MKVRKVICLIFFVSLTTISLASSDQSPVINKDQGIIVLPPKMKKAIEASNPSFAMWKSEDYTPTILHEDHQKDNRRKLPFALIVDANEDNIADVILDGHDNERALLLGVISKGDEYRVLIIEEKKLVSPGTIENVFEGKKEYGLSYFLWTLETRKERKEKKEVFMIGYPQQTAADGELLNDGSFAIYSYFNGKFYVEYLTL
ncbi:MAG: hypothetical protein P8075_11440 [Deltaproteobacteria bacterium]|jgi:hypothetical protein